LKRLYIFIILFFVHIVHIYAIQVHAQHIIDFEDVNKTMKYVEQLFINKNLKVLPLFMDEYLSSKKRKVNEFKKLIENYSINSGHTKEKCFKSFKISSGPFSKYMLVIIFDRINRKWCVSDSFLQKKNNTDKVTVFDKKGFAPLALEYNFHDFIQVINNGTINQYLGLAPFGNLNSDFFKENRIETTEKSTVHITNLILHHDNSIDNLVYFELKYYPNILKNSARGWLLHDWGTMLEYLKIYDKDNYLADMIDETNWDKLVTKSNFNLKKKSNFFFANAPYDKFLERLINNSDKEKIKHIERINSNYDQNNNTFYIKLLNKQINYFYNPKNILCNKDIRLIQKKFKELGYSITADGCYGKVTKKIVQQYQQDNRLFTDGVIGKQTLELLFNEE